MSKSTKRNSGFTLIELMVVILVISALSGVLLSVINSSGIRGKARDAQRKADLKRIQSALELYFADNRQYPKSPNSGNTWEQIDSDGSLIETALDPDYINPIPTDPSGEVGTNVGPCSTPLFRRYNYKSDGTYYYLTAIMEVTTSKDDSPCTDISLGCGTVNTSDVCYYVQNP